MKNVLISGINGFVGGNLSAHLKNKEWNVSALGRNNVQKSIFNGANFTWHDLSPIMNETFEAIVHLAGKAHDLKKTSNDEEYFAVNTELTKSLFDVFLKSKVKDFIYFSSVKAVADTVIGVLNEDAKSNPLTPYGKSKQQAEEYLLKQGLTEGKRLFILRPCMIHGPGNKGNLNLLYKVVQRGIPYPLAAFQNQRSFLSIANLNYIIEKIISDPNIPGGVYNVADDYPLSTNEVIKIISEANSSKARLWKINPSLVQFMAKIGDKLKLPLNTERLTKLTESYVVSNKKIKNALNVKELPVSANEGLIATIKSFRSS